MSEPVDDADRWRLKPRAPSPGPLAVIVAVGVSFGVVLTVGVYLEPFGQPGSVAAALALGSVFPLTLLFLELKGHGGLVGPLFFYDLVRLARQGRTTVLRCVYGLFLLGALGLAYLDRVGTEGGVQGLVESGQPVDFNALARLGMVFFSALLAVQSAAIVVLTPVYLAGAIHEERERGTLQLLFTTHLYDREIVLGKLLARITHLGGLLLTGLPVLCLIQFWGGVDARLAAAAFAATALSLLSAGSISIFCSVYVPNRFPALFLAYVLVGVQLLFCLPCYGAVASPYTFILEADRRIYSPEMSFGGGFAGFQDDPGILLAEMILPYAMVHCLIALVCTLLAVRSLRKHGLSLEDEAPDEAMRFGARRFATHLADRVARAGEQPLTPGSPFLFPVRPVGDEPLLWKEVHFSMRQGAGLARDTLFLLVFSGTLVTVGIGLLAGTPFFPGNDLQSWPTTTVASGINLLLRCLLVVHLALLCAGAGFRAAAALSQEREQRTLDALLCLPVERDVILKAKWWGCLLWVRPFAWSLGLVLAAGTITATIHPLAVLLVVLAAAVHAAFLASLGTWLSEVCGSTLRATLILALAALALVLSPWVVLSFGRSVAVGWSGKLLEVGVNPLGAWWYLGFGWGQFDRGGEVEKLVAAVLGLIGYAAAAWLFWKLARRHFLTSTG